MLKKNTIEFENVNKLNKHIDDPRTLELREIFQMFICTLFFTGVLWVQLYHHLNSRSPVPLNMTLLGNGVFVDIIKFN